MLQYFIFRLNKIFMDEFDSNTLVSPQPKIWYKQKHIIAIICCVVITIIAILFYFIFQQKNSKNLLIPSQVRQTSLPTKINTFELEKDFTLTIPNGWSVTKEIEKDEGLSGLVEGEKLNSYGINIPSKYNGALTSINVRINIFSENKLATYSYNYDNWIFFEPEDNNWYAMNDGTLGKHPLTYDKANVVYPHTEHSTDSGLTILSNIGYGDAGCGNEHHLIHLKKQHLFVDFDFNSCFIGDQTLDGELAMEQDKQSTQIFNDFESEWLKFIKSFKLIEQKTIYSNIVAQKSLIYSGNKYTFTQYCDSAPQYFSAENQPKTETRYKYCLGKNLLTVKNQSSNAESILNYMTISKPENAPALFNLSLIPSNSANAFVIFTYYPDSCETLKICEIGQPTIINYVYDLNTEKLRSLKKYPQKYDGNPIWNSAGDKALFLPNSTGSYCLRNSVMAYNLIQDYTISTEQMACSDSTSDSVYWSNLHWLDNNTGSATYNDVKTKTKNEVLLKW